MENWVEINYYSRGTHNTNNPIKSKISMLTSGWCNYSDAYILGSGTIEIPNKGGAAAAAPNNRKNMTIKICAAFTDYVSAINNTQRDHAKGNDVVMPIHNLVECSDNYLKTIGWLWKYYRDESFSDANGNIADFPVDNQCLVSI